MKKADPSLPTTPERVSNGQAHGLWLTASFGVDRDKSGGRYEHASTQPRLLNL